MTACRSGWECLLLGREFDFMLASKPTCLYLSFLFVQLPMNALKLHHTNISYLVERGANVLSDGIE